MSSLVIDSTALKSGAAAMGIALSAEQLDQFNSFARLLAEWNEKLNLTAVPPEEYVSRHFLDSLAVASAACWLPAGRVVDVGTGAGFPGIPLKIAFPQIELILVESLQKRCNFLNEVVNQLGMTKVTVIPERGELSAHSPQLRETFDIATARAVAHLSILSEILIPYLKPGGWLILLKGASIEQEVAETGETIAHCGGGQPRIERVSTANSTQPSTLLITEKKSHSSAKIPRSYAAISRRQLQKNDLR